MSKKLLCIGLDACAPEMILKYQRYMPNLTRLMNKGVYGDLVTPPPPTTANGWQLILYGKNAAKINLFTFEHSRDYIMHFFDKTDKLKGKRIWDYLTSNNLKTICFNVPGTYPVKEMDGVLVSSFCSTGDKWAYPETVKQELEAVGFKTPLEKGINEFPDLKKYVDYWSVKTQVVMDSTIALAKKHEWNFLFPTFLVLDRIQHHFMNRQGGQQIIHFLHAYIDSIIGRLLHELKPDNVIVCSDHGMKPISKGLHLNTWLYEKGYLWLPEKQDNIFSSKLSYFPIDSFNFKRTTAWSTGQGGIVINDKRFNGPVTNTEGTCEVLIHDLLELRDPETGKSPFGDVCRKEDMWHGKYLEMMPDIIVTPNMHIGCMVHWRRLAPRLFQDYGNYADHSVNGFYCVSGKNVSSKGNKQQSILSIFPTILELLDFVPGDEEEEELADLDVESVI
jgi:predicted AlkP superfamily phosphohydrolase/phosphomutase